MSTLSVTNISDGTNSTATTNVVQGSAKAWVSWNGTTNTGGNCDILAAYNVSSVTDSATGNYAVNFTNALTDADYSIVGMAIFDSTYTASQIQGDTRVGTNTSSIAYISTFNPPGNAFVDTIQASVAVFR